MVVVYHDPLGHGLCLAGQDKTLFELPRLQRIVDVHLCFALDKSRPACRAHPALAGERQIDTGAQGSVEDGLTFGDRYLAALAVDNERDKGLRRCAWGNHSLRPRLAAESGHKTLDV